MSFNSDLSSVYPACVKRNHHNLKTMN